MATDKNFVIKNGLTVGTSEIITSAGNLTNIGTITTSGNLHAGDGTNISMDSSANGQLEVDGNGYQGAIALDANAMHLYHNSSNRSLVLGTNETARLTIGGTGTFDFNSNNLQSIGTISSGAITSSGIIESATTGTGNAKLIADGGGAANVEIDRGSTSYHNNLLYRTAGVVKWRIWQSGADNSLAVRNETSTTDVLTFTDNNSTFAGTVAATGGNSTNWNTAYGWGNHASQSYITNSTASLDANKITSGVLNAARIPSPVNGDWWNGGVVKVGTDGVMEVGKYLDFHTADSGGNADYDLRVTASAGALAVGGTISATGGNSTNWNTAYGWGNHAGLYLGATAKAADSNLFDGVDSVLYQRYRADIGNAIDLNTYTTMGIYNQNSNAQATAGSNYPANVAGMLTVTADGLMIYQTYQGYASHGTYERKYYNGTWESWHLVYDSGVFTNNSANWNTAYGWGNHASQSYATQSYVGTQISNLVDSSPAALNTLNELAAALGDNENFATDVNASIAAKLPLAGGTMTGTLAMGANAITSTGTISSGAITAPSLNSTGTITINSTGVNPTVTLNRYSGQPNLKAGTDDGGYLIMDSSGNSLGLNWYSSDNIVIGLGGGNTGIGISPSGYKLHVNGTIGSGAITSSGTSNFERFRLTDTSKMGFGTVLAGASIGHTASVEEGIFWHQTSDYGIYRTAGAWSSPNYQQLKLKWHTGIEIDGNGTVYGKSGINFLNGNIKMDGTQILDASRNLFNIGTISSGAINTTGNVTLGTFSTANTGTLILTGSTANKSAELKCTNGNLHIDSEAGNATYINYFEGTGGVFFGTGAGGHQAHINSAGGINLRGSGAAPTNSAIAVNGTSILDNSRNLTSIGTIASGAITGTTITAVSAIGAADNVRTGLTHDDSTPMASGVGGQLVLGYKYTSSGDYTEGAIIKMYKENGTSGHYGSGLKFQVRNHLANLSTKMYLDPSGNLAVTGTISSGAITSSGNLSISKDNPVLILNETTSSSNANQVAYISFQDNGTEEAWIGWGSGSNSDFTITNNIGSVVLNGNGTTQINDNLDLNGNADISGTIQTTGDVLINGSFAADPWANAGARLRFCGGTQPQDYYIGTNLENVGGNYSKLDLRWHTGIRMGAQGVYGGIRFYNNEDLTSKLMSIGEGSGVTDVKVYNDLQVDAGIKVGSSATRLSQSGVQLKVQTTSGYCEIGPTNSSWMHFETDRARFYFNTLITVDSGIVQSYDEDLILRRAQNSSHQLTIGTSGITATGAVTAVSYGAPSGTTALYYGFNGREMVTGVDGAAYYHGSDGGGYGIVIQGGHPICRSLKIGTVNAGETVIDSSRNLVNIASATFSNDVAINNGSPELYFGTTGNHYNWRIAAQENVDAALEISVGSQDTNYANDTYTTKFHITNSGNATFAGNVTAYSDERLKENIKTLDGSKVYEMRGVSFEKEGVQGSGVIAQELEKIAPELVHTAKDEMGTKSVAYGNLVGYLIEAVKEQQKQIDELKQEVTSLRSKI